MGSKFVPTCSTGTGAPGCPGGRRAGCRVPSRYRSAARCPLRRPSRSGAGRRSGAGSRRRPCRSARAGEVSTVSILRFCKPRLTTTVKVILRGVSGESLRAVILVGFPRGPLPLLVRPLPRRSRAPHPSVHVENHRPGQRARVGVVADGLVPATIETLAVQTRGVLGDGVAQRPRGDGQDVGGDRHAALDRDGSQGDAEYSRQVEGGDFRAVTVFARVDGAVDDSGLRVPFRFEDRLLRALEKS